MGLGDATYLQSVARHLTAQGQRLRVATAWPDVFRPLGDKVEIAPFTRAGINILAHYSLRKSISETTQFEDCCIQAGISGPVELRLDWTPTNTELIQRLSHEAQGVPRFPIVCVQLPRAPMGRNDGFGAELLPDCRAIQTVINAVRGQALIVQIGAGKALYKFEGIDIDLSNRTTVCELFDVACVASAFIGYPSFIIPLAESLNKPALLVWSRRGLNANQAYVRQITPRKILFKQSSRFVMDDAPQEEITKAAHDLLNI